ncbi:putative DNA binding domain-containing protein [Candidatus Parcubacteria bacterium]|nr:putative DNA binding domain-containing protein [Candidatus Parcubacteria bacterium]
MNENKIKNLIKEGESQKVEFKSKINDGLGKSICSFANTNNGVVLVGVGDNGKIIGVPKKYERDIANIAHSCKPSTYPEVISAEIEGENIFIVQVKKSDNLHSFKNIAYRRISSHNKPLSPEEVIAFAKDIGKIKWDNQICAGASLDNIDEEKIKWFLRKAKYERNFDVEPETPIKEALERLELIKDGKLTNAGVLLFGKNPQKFFLQAETRCAKFKGIEPLEFIDMKVFSGNIINQRNDAVEFVKEHIKLHAKIVDTERVEKWEYPIEAVREAITNAVCHRDYEVSSHIQIRIFDDRVEVWGCGSLPKPLTIKDLKKKHKSVLRNHLIGKCFFLIKFIEEWGTGTNRIIEQCLKHGLPEPLFENITDSLVITFRKYRISKEDVEKFNERQKKAIQFLKEHKKITLKDYRNIQTTLTEKTAYRDLIDMEEKSIIRSVGEKKGRYYILI